MYYTFHIRLSSERLEYSDRSTMSRVATTTKSTRTRAKTLRRKRPVVENIVVTTSQRRVRPAGRRVGTDPLTSAIEALISTFSSPNILLTTAVTLFIAIDYQNNPNDNIIIAAAKHFGRDTAFGHFMINNGAKFIGMLMLLPAAYAAPKSQRLASVCATLLTAYLMPTVSYLTYFVLSLSMRIFYGTNNRELRFFFIAIAGFLIFLTATSHHSGNYIFNKYVKDKEKYTTTTALPTTTESNEL